MQLDVVLPWKALLGKVVEKDTKSALDTYKARWTVNSRWRRVAAMREGSPDGVLERHGRPPPLADPTQRHPLAGTGRRSRATERNGSDAAICALLICVLASRCAEVRLAVESRTLVDRCGSIRSVLDV